MAFSLKSFFSSFCFLSGVEVFAEGYVVGLLSMERGCGIGVSKNQANAAWELVLFRPCHGE